MRIFFPNIPVIPYEGPNSANQFYNPDQIVIGAKSRAGETTLEELAVYAENMGAPELPGSGRQEYLESIVNNVLFCG